MAKPHPAPIPQMDLKGSYLARQDEIDAAIARVLQSGWYILGQEVTAFEEEFARYIGAREGIGVASGTDALFLALRACGVSAEDLVVTVSHTAVATVAAVELCGARPVLVDVDLDSATMDLDQLEGVLSKQANAGRAVKAVIPVHLYGQPAMMPGITRLAHQYGARVVEDCAQAHGAEIDGRRVGAWGDVAAFSFYPTKNLGALGDGGMVVTNDQTIGERVRMLRQYGWRTRYISDEPGVNSRLDELQAAILRVKLRSLDRDTERRREIAANYGRRLAGTRLLRLPSEAPSARHVYHLYVVCTPERDRLQAHLRARGIGTLVHYPVPVHLQPAYANRLASFGTLPHTERLAREVLSLPMYPELTDEHVATVAKAIVRWDAGASTM